MIARSDRFYARYAAQVGGFDLLKDHPDPARPDLLHYYAAIDRACPADAALCLDEPERAMRALLERAWAGKPRFVLVTRDAIRLVQSMMPNGALASAEVRYVWRIS